MSKVLVVTGGSRGIGRETALLAAERGYDICINYASDEAAAQAVKREIEAKGRKAIAVCADVSNETAVEALFKEADKLGPLSALVNSAGLLPKPDRIENTNLARLQRIFEVNVFGTFLCSREAVRRMSTKFGGKGGVIVNVSSMIADIGGAGRAVEYGATKAAIDTLTVGLAREVAEEGIRVNAVKPGPIETDMLKAPEQKGRIAVAAGLNPMKRVGRAEEVAAAVLWLLSDEASYTTAATIRVSGGL
jgi:NAD(P)-dependent dehydrogenase (short-subunit alcohol dehydrogenase family)